MRAGLSQSIRAATRGRVENRPARCAHCSPSRDTSSPVAMRPPGGVALHCRESVPGRLTDCKRVGERPYSSKLPLWARSSPSPRGGVRHEGARRNQFGVVATPPSLPEHGTLRRRQPLRRGRALRGAESVRYYSCISSNSILHIRPHSILQ